MKSYLHTIALAAAMAVTSISSLAKPVAVESEIVRASLQQLPALSAAIGVGESVRVAINPQPLPPKAPPREDLTHSTAPDLMLAGGPPTVVDFWGRLPFIG